MIFCQNLVVCIRQRAPLTKFEKMWNSPCIAIEDPFDLGHNLGAGISRKSELVHNGCDTEQCLTIFSCCFSELVHQEGVHADEGAIREESCGRVGTIPNTRGKWTFVTVSIQLQ